EVAIPAAYASKAVAIILDARLPGGLRPMPRGLCHLLIPARRFLYLLRSRPLSQADPRCLTSELSNLLDGKCARQLLEVRICLRRSLSTWLGLRRRRSFSGRPTDSSRSPRSTGSE